MAALESKAKGSSRCSFPKTPRQSALVVELVQAVGDSRDLCHWVQMLVLLGLVMVWIYCCCRPGYLSIGTCPFVQKKALYVMD